MRLPAAKKRTFPGAFVVTVMVTDVPLYAAPLKVGAEIELGSLMSLIVRVNV
jgi:hypothetical protein